jgi:primary-amine oxidase
MVGSKDAKEADQRARPRHPLDPLASWEMRAAVDALRAAGRMSGRARVVQVALHEPPKDEVLAFEDRQDFRREAAVVVLEPGEGITYEALVDLAAAQLLDWRPVPGAKAPVTLDEYAECERIVRSDPDFQAGLKKRGIAQPDQVLVEPWGIGGFAAPEDANLRIVWTLCFYRADPADLNPYAKPVEGLHAIVDLNEMRVLRVEDFGVVPLPPGDGAYNPGKVGPARSGLKPLEIHQPQGGSFEVDGWEIRWQKWRLRLGWTQREGLVLHTIGYDDGGRIRPIVYRASIAELVIPYADPRPGVGWRNAFDIGEYGIGIMTNSLELGCDCLGVVRYFDVEMVNSQGEPYVVKQAICLHEEDFGLLWKHLDAATGRMEVRRSRRLVVSFIITAGNYEYAFYWYFYQDGTIELEVKLTGIVLTSALLPGETSEYGTIVAPQTLAANHQHFFSVRLDMAVDGLKNSVFEVNTEPLPPGAANPYGNAFTARQTPFRTEREAQRCIDPLAGRYWLVVNPGTTNGLGQPAGYKLVPQANVLPFAHPTSSVARRAAFMTKHLWVTPFNAAERFPAGEYPNQHPGGAGLPEWTEADRPIENTDLVVWYTLGSHHIPRPEDWPVMPVERAGFLMKPSGFFDRNPALDVPPSP